VILGIDVHNGYSRIDWGRVAQSGVRFAIVKATQGNDGCDPRARENIAGCKAAGIYVGAYLFGYPLPENDAKPGRSPEDQARRLYNDVHGLGKLPGELPPALDLEWPPQHERDKVTSQIRNRWEEWGVTAKGIVEWAERCVAEMERLWGRTPTPEEQRPRTVPSLDRELHPPARVDAAGGRPPHSTGAMGRLHVLAVLRRRFADAHSRHPGVPHRSQRVPRRPRRTAPHGEHRPRGRHAAGWPSVAPPAAGDRPERLPQGLHAAPAARSGRRRPRRRGVVDWPHWPT
jgi:hypothetical protein